MERPLIPSGIAQGIFPNSELLPSTSNWSSRNRLPKVSRHFFEALFRPFFFTVSLTVVFGLFLSAPFFRNLPETALRTRVGMSILPSFVEMDHFNITGDKLWTNGSEIYRLVD